MNIPRALTVRLMIFHASPRSDDPLCICSLCHLPLLDPDLAETRGEPDDRGGRRAIEAGDQMPPIRMWPPPGNGKPFEIRFHPACYEKVAGPDSDPMKLRFRPDLHVSWTWGDDEDGRLVLTPGVTP